MPTASGKLRIAIVIVILALAAFFRFYRITETPPGLYPDEAANGNNAVEVLHTSSFKIFYPENNGREGLFINLQAVSIKLFGAEPWALRVVSALFGTLTILGLYLLTKELFSNAQISKSESLISKQSQNPNDKNLFRDSRLEIRDSHSEIIALLSSFFLAVSYWHINFSRIGFRAIMVPFFAVFGMYWLLKALRTEKISSTILAGIFTGLGFYTYIAFRLMPFVLAVPILTALVSWWRGRQAQRCVPCVVALFLFVTFIVALPIGFYFLQHPQDFFGRGGQVSIFSAESPLYEFAKSTALTLGMFNFWGDCNQRHNLNCEPQLFWPVGILFVVGLLITIRSASRGWQKSEARSTKSETDRHAVILRSEATKEPPEILRSAQDDALCHFGFRISRNTAWLLLAWFIFLMLPATLTREGLPHALRSIGMIPPVMIFAGLGGAWLWHYLTIRISDFGFRISVIAAVLFLVWIPINTYRDYFIRFAYAPETRDAFAVDLLGEGRYLTNLPDETKKIVIVNLMGDNIRGIPAPAQTIMFASDTFDENRRRQKQVVYLTRLDDIHIDTGEKVVIIPLNPREPGLITAIQQRFPAMQMKVPGDFVVFEKPTE